MDWTQPTPITITVETGVATYYRPGLMQQVVDVRGIPLNGRIPVALNRAGDLGRQVWLEWPDGTVETAISVDCAQKGHYLKRLQLHRVVEVSAEHAKLHGFYAIGPAPVKVWYKPPYARTSPPPGPADRRRLHYAR